MQFRDLAKQYNVRKDMAYIIACYHDLGLQFGRETHHITSGDLLLNDSFISSCKKYKITKI